MAHANARLTPAGRLTLVGRIAAQPLDALFCITAPQRLNAASPTAPAASEVPTVGEDQGDETDGDA